MLIVLSKPAKIMTTTAYQRPQGETLACRLDEERRFIQVLSGPRQVGKTTLVRQVMNATGLRAHFASADGPTLRDVQWVGQQWRQARRDADVLVLDEVQKISGWSEAVKQFWDEDSHNDCPLKVVILGSAPLLIARYMTESLAGRFEIIRLPHWSFGEMRRVFGWPLEWYLYYGGYPGAAQLLDWQSLLYDDSTPPPEADYIMEPPRSQMERAVQRWRQYVLDALVEPTISRDVLLMSRVDKPALLRQLFELGCRYSGQILSYSKMLGQLHDAGNTTTLAHYLELLGGAGMLRGLPKYAGSAIRLRRSIPKLQVLNNALMSVYLDMGLEAAQADGAIWGRLVESAVGAHLANATTIDPDYRLLYWRQGNAEVDFVMQAGKRLWAIEVKSGRTPNAHKGSAAFAAAFAAHNPKLLMIGDGGIPVQDFLAKPLQHWLGNG